MSTTLAALPRTKTLTLEQLAAELLRQQEAKLDAVVDTRRMSFETLAVAGEADHRGIHQGTENVSHLSFDGADDDVITGAVNDYAHGQIAQRVGIPKAYYDRMRSEAPELLDSNVLHWFHEQPEKRLVRLLDNRVRALLSNRYRRLDSFDLMEHGVLPAFSKVDGLQFHVAALTDKHMYVRAILPRVEREVVVGDVVQAGVEIRNSEVGAGALEVNRFVWRLVCLNGMLTGEALRKHHVGKRVEETEETYSVYREETLRADDRAFYLKVRDLVTASLSEARFDEIVRGLREIATGERVENPVAATEYLSNAYKLDDGEQASVLRNLVEGGDLSQWGMVNAVTASAKDSETFDRQVALEEIGGQVATLASTGWAKVAEAA